MYGERLKPSGLRNLLTDEPAPWEAALQAGLDAAAAAGEGGAVDRVLEAGLHLQLVVDHEVRPLGTMPPLYHNFLRGHGLVEAGRGGRFRPLVYVNELTVMRMHWIAINTTRACASSAERARGRAAAAAAKEDGARVRAAARALVQAARRLPLPVDGQPEALVCDAGVARASRSPRFAGITARRSPPRINRKESCARFVTDVRPPHTHPVLLYTTVAVSALHMLFDVLAFKNDLSFWSSARRRAMEGLSTRSLLLNEGWSS